MKNHVLVLRGKYTKRAMNKFKTELPETRNTFKASIWSS